MAAQFAPTEIFHAAASGDARQVQEWLAGGGDANAPFHVDHDFQYAPRILEYGLRLLGVAAWHGQCEVIKLLLAAGADVNHSLRSQPGRPPHHALLIAVTYGQVEAVRILVDNGADVNYDSNNPEGHEPPPECTQPTSSVAMSAVYYGDSRILMMLLRAGLNTAARSCHTVQGLNDTPEEFATANNWVDAYLRLRTAAVGVSPAGEESRIAAATFETQPLASLVAPEVRDRMRPRSRRRRNPLPGYSDGELRRIVAAARADVIALRDRLTATTPADLTGSARDRLDAARETGKVSVAGLPLREQPQTRARIARQLFVTNEDLTPMLVLLVATTGWNVEVIKDLPSHHRRIEDLAVELEVTKRRRGAGRWHQTVTWEIGPSNKELMTPGGVYLLLHALMAPARDLLADAPFWATWHRAGQRKQGCRNPFGHELGANVYIQRWVRAHQLLADPVSTGDAATSGGELAGRVVVSIVACAFVTWQLAETANWRADATYAATEVKRCCRLGGSPLQWYLVLLMLLAALDGVVGVVVDLYLMAKNGGAVHLAVAQQEFTLQLILGKLSQLILSLMIIGLGVSGLSRGAPNSRAATVLGVASLVIRRLPAPLVLVLGVRRLLVVERLVLLLQHCLKTSVAYLRLPLDATHDGALCECFVAHAHHVRSYFNVLP